MDNAEQLRADIRTLVALIDAAPGVSRNDLTLKVCLDMLRERKQRLQQIEGTADCARLRLV